MPEDWGSTRLRTSWTAIAASTAVAALAQDPAADFAGRQVGGRDHVAAGDREDLIVAAGCGLGGAAGGAGGRCLLSVGAVRGQRHG